MENVSLYAREYPSPAGKLCLLLTDTALLWLGFGPPEAGWLKRWFGVAPPPPSAGGALAERVCGQLDAYFSGERTVFDLPLEIRGTEYQKRVWAALLEIPYGQTVSYGELARRVGSGPRAVGQANHRNPVSIIVPCHRVIGADGGLTGYGGGLDRKQWLLNHEKTVLLRLLPASPP